MKLTKLTLSLLSAFALAYSASASATIVDIDASTNAYDLSTTVVLNFGGPVSLTLAAGDYTWANAAGQGTYNDYAYNLGGAGWTWNFAAYDSTTLAVVASADVGKFTTQAAAIAAATGLNGTFSLSKTTTLNFGVLDNWIYDNQGGVSIKVTAVPEPEAYAMMLAGLGLVGFAARRKMSA